MVDYTPNLQDYEAEAMTIREMLSHLRTQFKEWLLELRLRWASRLLAGTGREVALSQEQSLIAASLMELVIYVQHSGGLRSPHRISAYRKVLQELGVMVLAWSSSVKGAVPGAELSEERRWWRNRLRERLPRITETLSPEEVFEERLSRAFDFRSVALHVYPTMTDEEALRLVGELKARMRAEPELGKRWA